MKFHALCLLAMLCLAAPAPAFHRQAVVVGHRAIAVQRVVVRPVVVRQFHAAPVLAAPVVAAPVYAAPLVYSAPVVAAPVVTPVQQQAYAAPVVTQAVTGYCQQTLVAQAFAAPVYTAPLVSGYGYGGVAAVRAFGVHYGSGNIVAVRAPVVRIRVR